MPQDDQGPRPDEHHTHITGMVNIMDGNGPADATPLAVEISEHITGEDGRAWCVTRCEGHDGWMIRQGGTGNCPDPCPSCSYRPLLIIFDPVNGRPMEALHDDQIS